VNKWKIIFKKQDGSTTKLTNKVQDLDLRLAKKYNKQYGNNCISKTVFLYPLKDHTPMSMDEYIEQQRLIESENSKCFFSK
jgi:hypothetical protein